MKNIEPLVTVVITTKNEEKNIERLLRSIVAQSYKKLEVVIVDNNSTDRTKEISKKFTKHVYDMGPERSAQRNFGAKMAKGGYLLFLDADMELTPDVVGGCVRVVITKAQKAVVIPERTVGNGLMARVRQFERKMYVGDSDIEVARFFDKKVFSEFDGYDLNLTGPEDFDLPYRIGKKYPIGRSRGYILHHEEEASLGKLLKKKFYYASKGSRYAEKHPELVWKQGNLLFRKAYLRNWTNFVKHPFVGAIFLAVRALETTWAVSGYISVVGLKGFVRTLLIRR